MSGIEQSDSPVLMQELPPLGLRDFAVWDVYSLIQAVNSMGILASGMKGDMYPKIEDTDFGPVIFLPVDYMRGKRRDPQAVFATAQLIGVIAKGYHGNAPVYIGRGGVPYTSEEISVEEAVQEDAHGLIYHELEGVEYGERTRVGNDMRRETRRFALDLLIAESWEQAKQLAQQELGIEEETAENHAEIEDKAEVLLEGEDGLLVPKGSVAEWRSISVKKRGSAVELLLEDRAHWDAIKGDRKRGEGKIIVHVG